MDYFVNLARTQMQNVNDNNKVAFVECKMSVDDSEGIRTLASEDRRKLNIVANEFRWL